MPQVAASVRQGSPETRTAHINSASITQNSQGKVAFLLDAPPVASPLGHTACASASRTMRQRTFWGWNPSAIIVVHMHLDIRETHSWCAVTLVWVCAGARGVAQGSGRTSENEHASQHCVTHAPETDVTSLITRINLILVFQTLVARP